MKETHRYVNACVTGQGDASSLPTRHRASQGGVGIACVVANIGAPAVLGSMAFVPTALRLSRMESAQRSSPKSWGGS
jgi:hypothetical protein